MGIAPDPKHRLLFQRCEAAAAAESAEVRARAWADKSDDERAEALIEVMRLADMIWRSLDRPRAPLTYPRVPSGSPRRAG